MLRLERQTITQETFVNRHVWPLRVSVTSLQPGLTNNVFVFHAALQDDLYCGDVFECVASVQQLNDLPENKAAYDDNGKLVPYYRTNTLVFNARTPLEAEELWDAIKDDTQDLARNWAALNNFEDSDSWETDVVLREDLNVTGHNLIGVDKIGINTLNPTYAIDIDPNSDPTTEDRGIRFGGDTVIYRSGDSQLVIEGNVTINGELNLDVIDGGLI